MRLTTPTGETKEFYLLAPHPREDTWLDDGKIYSAMIRRSLGASEITFILDANGGESLIARRYQNPLHAKWMHETTTSPYGDSLSYRPRAAPPNRLREIHTFSDILSAAANQNNIFGVAEYSTHGVAVQIDFPVRVLNINPKTRKGEVPKGKQWQVASSRVPVYVPTGKPSEPVTRDIRCGQLAFSRFEGALQFVYLDRTFAVWNDFNRTVNFDGAARLFERIVG